MTKKFISFFLALFITCIYAFGTAEAASYTVGTAQTYPDLKSAFDAINAGTITGDIELQIVTSTTETAPCVLNSTGAGSASYTSVKIYPVNNGLTISGATTSGRGVIELNGADNVTIDGALNASGTTRSLTITNTAADVTTYTSVVRVALSTLITSANSNTVKNCFLNGSATGRNISTATSTTGSENTTWGIIVGGGASTVTNTTPPSALTSATTTIGAGITATSFTASNNAITACARGIAVNGAAITVADLLNVSNNTIGSATAGNTTTVYARGISVQGFNNTTISGNTIQNMEYFVSSAQMGISLGDVSATGTNATLDNNVVNGVNNRSTGTYGAYGINLVAGANQLVKNNRVYNITGDMTGGVAFSTTFGIFGIRIGSSTGHKVYQNTVSLSGARTGTANSSLLSACLAILSATTNTGCDVRNNIFSNTQTGGTTSLAYVCLYLPPSGTATMNLNLNNNAYYSGSTVGSTGIAHVGTTYTAVPAGPTTYAGLYTAANFSNTPGGNLNFSTYSNVLLAGNDALSLASTAAAPLTADLHTNTGLTPTKLESGGNSAVGVTTDIDGQVRPGPAGSVNGGATSNDIGADEFDGVPSIANDMEAVAFINPVNPGYKPSNTTFTCQAQFRNAGTAGQTNVPVSFKIFNAGNTQVYTDDGSSTVTLATGASTTVTFTPNVVGGLVAGVYTMKAKVSLAGDQNTSNDEIVGTLNVGNPLSGPYTVGLADFNRSTGRNITLEKVVKRVMKEVPEYAPISRSKNNTESVTETSPVDGKFTGMVTKEVEEVTYVMMENGREYTGPQFDDATGDFATLTAATQALNNYGGSGAVTFNLTDATYTGETLPIVVNNPLASATNTLTIKPSTYASASASCGTQSASISGASAGGAVIKVLSSYTSLLGLKIENTSAATPIVVHFGSTGTTTMTNCKIDDCTLINGATTSSALVLTDASSTATGGYFQNMTISNNCIQKAYIGVYSFYATAAGNGNGCTYTSNAINTSGANNVRLVGIYVQGADGAVVSKNDIGNFSGTEAEDDKGIWCATGTTNSTVEKNQIHDLVYTGTGGYGCHGIYMSSGTSASNNTVKNNMIANMSGDGWNYTSIPLDNPIGIVATGAQTGLNIYNNSINLYGNTLNQTSAMSMGIYLGAGSVADIRNNSIVNNKGLSAALGYGTVGVYAVTDNTQFSTINYNNYYVNPTGSGVKYVGQIAAAGSVNLAAWKLATLQDANSKSGDPQYQAPTNLHISLATSSILNNNGSSLAAVPDDIDGDTRVHAWAPDIGADEFQGSYVLNLKVCLQNCATNNITVTVFDGSCGVLGNQTVSLTGVGPIDVVFTGINDASSFANMRVTHLNSLQIWSSLPLFITDSRTSWDFTLGPATEAYGNMVYDAGLANWCMPIGDVDQDGEIGGSDKSYVENDITCEAPGCTSTYPTDLANCDDYIDASDLAVVENNNGFVSNPICGPAPKRANKVNTADRKTINTNINPDSKVKDADKSN
ncbi:MAG: hypothetical protein JNJ56_04850 [Ignavibacteria bacterium]|nr:hypothetical protein [Ignavibacteria bacterium]